MDARPIVLAAFLTGSSPAPAPAAAPPASPCPSVTVALDDGLVASRAQAGQSFRYTTTASADPRIRPGLHGSGRIAALNRARKNSIPADVKLQFDPVETGHGSYALRGNADDGTLYVAGGANRTRTGFTLIPDIGTMLSIRNIFQTGKDLELPAGTTFCVRVG